MVGVRIDEVKLFGLLPRDGCRLRDCWLMLWNLNRYLIGILRISCEAIAEVHHHAEMHGCIEAGIKAVSRGLPVHQAQCKAVFVCLAWETLRLSESKGLFDLGRSASESFSPPLMDSRLVWSVGGSPGSDQTSWPSRPGHKAVTWLILPVVICSSQRLSHACLSINCLYCETANGSLNQL